MPEEDASHLGLRILEREVAVTGGRPREVGDLAGHPCQRQAALDERPRPGREITDREDRDAESGRRLRTHGAAAVASPDDHMPVGPRRIAAQREVAIKTLFSNDICGAQILHAATKLVSGG
jgi:hypothetical protein